MNYERKTIKGYDFYEVSSALQKSIRRADKKYSGYFALELFHSGFHNYVWKRLLTISAEDCYGLITKEILALRESFYLINEGVKDKKKGRIFISKAVILLCETSKSREADHLQCLIYDRVMKIEDDIINNYFEEIRKEVDLEIPDYAFDVHTRKGKIAGKTKGDFFIEEQEALTPKTEQTEIDFCVYLE